MTRQLLVLIVSTLILVPYAMKARLTKRRVVGGREIQQRRKVVDLAGCAWAGFTEFPAENSIGRGNNFPPGFDQFRMHIIDSLKLGQRDGGCVA